MSEHFRFLVPHALWLLIPVALLLVLRPRRGGAGFGAYNLALAALRPARGPLVQRLLFTVACAALVIALARPQYGRDRIAYEQLEGRDIMLVLDLSLSMVANDMITPEEERITRLEAVTRAARAFIDKRPHDRIGLVYFAEDAFTSCPLTHDHTTLDFFLTETEANQLALWERSLRRGSMQGILGNGTNLGLGLGIALRRLVPDPEALPPTDIEQHPGRAVVLITDGRDTEQLDNWRDPLEAAEHADRLGVDVHAIGVGDPQGIMSDPRFFLVSGEHRPMRVPASMLPDLGRLRDITDIADGISRHASRPEQITDILDSIESLTPSEQEIPIRPDYRDRFLWPLVLGLALLGCVQLLEPRLRGVT